MTLRLLSALATGCLPPAPWRGAAAFAIVIEPAPSRGQIFDS